MEMRDTYINSNLNLLTKFTSSNKNTKFKGVLPCNMSEMSLKESQWKLRQTHDQNFQWSESHCRTNTSIRQKKQI